MNKIEVKLFKIYFFRVQNRIKNPPTSPRFNFDNFNTFKYIFLPLPE